MPYRGVPGNCLRRLIYGCLSTPQRLVRNAGTAILVPASGNVSEPRSSLRLPTATRPGTERKKPKKPR